MKKKLEAELISIAHRVLKIHNREEIVQLQKEALNLYEKLSILRFYEENFEPSKPTIGKADLELAIENIKLPQTKNLESDIQTTTQVVEVINNEVTTTSQNNLENFQEISISYEELEANGLNEDEPQHPIAIQVLDEIENNNIDQIIEQPLAKAVILNNNEEPISEELTNENIFEEDIINEEIFEDEIINEKTLLENTPNITATTDDVIIEQTLSFDNKKTKETEQKSENSKPIRSEEELNNFNYLSNLFSGIDDNYLDNKTPKKEGDIKSSFETLLGQNYQELEFVKADNFTIEKDVEEKPKKVKKEKKSKEVIETSIFEDAFDTNSKSVSEIYSNTITLGLNDRIAFQMHLFNDSDQDLNRVVSQLNTMNNKDEALDFINNMVKPDYNNWQGKEEFERRFMALVDKRFS